MNGTRDGWATLAAAAAMDCSVRTLQRRIAEGGLETRRRPDGKAEVRLRDVGGSDFDGQDQARHDVAPGPSSSDHALTLATGAISGWQTAAEQVKVELHRTRRLAGLMAATLALVAVGAVLMAWWGRGTIEASEAHAARLGDQVATQAARVVELVDQVQDERQRGDDLTRQLQTAAVESAVLASDLSVALADLSDRNAAEAIQAAATTSGEILARPSEHLEVVAAEDAPGG